MDEPPRKTAAITATAQLNSLVGMLCSLIIQVTLVGMAQTDPNAPKLKPRASPKRSIRSTSSPLAVSGSPARQSQPRARPGPCSPGRGTRTPELPVEVGPERSSSSLPMMEKVDAESEETDFLSSARGEDGAKLSDVPRLEERCSRSVERKHSSHCAYTRGVTVSRSSTADRMVNCWEVDRIGLGSSAVSIHLHVNADWHSRFTRTKASPRSANSPSTCTAESRLGSYNPP